MNEPREILLQDYREMRSKKVGIEDRLKYLRDKGCSKITSIRILMDLENMSLSDAKRIVHLSEAWDDVRVRDDKIHNILEDIANEMQRELPEDLDS